MPNYLQGPGLGRLFGDGTDTFRLKLRGGRWGLDVDELERAVGKTTKVIMVCNPNNPTGAVMTQEEMDAVVRVAERRGAWIVADEIYRGTEVEGDEPSPSFWGRSERVVVTSGLSKAFGLPGLRIGWAVGPEAFIHDLWERHDYTTLTPGMASDILCGAAMEPSKRAAIFERTRGIVRSQLPRMEEWIHTHDDIFRYARPTAGAIAYVKYRLPVSSTKLVDRIREEQSVLLVGGDQFGIGQGASVRLRVRHRVHDEGARARRRDAGRRREAELGRYSPSRHLKVWVSTDRRASPRSASNRSMPGPPNRESFARWSTPFRQPSLPGPARITSGPLPPKR